MAGALKSTSEGRTLILTLSNPEHRNALGPEIYAAGVEALNAAENNPEIRSVVIAGKAAHFAPALTWSDCRPTGKNRQKFRRKVSRPYTAGLTLSEPFPNR